MNIDCTRGSHGKLSPPVDRGETKIVLIDLVELLPLLKVESY